jgi:hypothetical protein
MKKFLIAANIVIWSFVGYQVTVYAETKKETVVEVKKDAAPAPETKKVCFDVQGKDGKPVMDPKTNKPKQNCTTVKVREKFEGTKIPEGTKK